MRRLAAAWRPRLLSRSLAAEAEARSSARQSLAAGLRSWNEARDASEMRQLLLVRLCLAVSPEGGIVWDLPSASSSGPGVFWVVRSCNLPKITWRMDRHLVTFLPSDIIVLVHSMHALVERMYVGNAAQTTHSYIILRTAKCIFRYVRVHP